MLDAPSQICCYFCHSTSWKLTPSCAYTCVLWSTTLVSASSRLKKDMVSGPSNRGPACQVPSCSLMKCPGGILHAGHHANLLTPVLYLVLVHTCQPSTPWLWLGPSRPAHARPACLPGVPHTCLVAPHCDALQLHKREACLKARRFSGLGYASTDPVGAATTMYLLDACLVFAGLARVDPGSREQYKTIVPDTGMLSCSPKERLTMAALQWRPGTV